MELALRYCACLFAISVQYQGRVLDEHLDPAHGCEPHAAIVSYLPKRAETLVRRDGGFASMRLNSEPDPSLDAFGTMF
jgi:hypothetical protein